MSDQLDILGAVIQKAEATEAAALDTLRHAPRMQEIDVVNESTVVSDADCARFVAAIQIQVARDFYPLWGLQARLNFIAKGGKPNPANWWMVVADTSDQAGALGYHSLSSAGQPLGYVFAKSDLESGSSVSVTLSHEVLEMLADDQINLMVQLDQTRLVAYENCDPCESDADGYVINGVVVSDFVLPSYFSPGHPGPWDYRKLLTAQMPALRPDGYLSIYVLGQGWTQSNAATSARMKLKAIPHVGSRRQRRATPRSDWERSAV